MSKTVNYKEKYEKALKGIKELLDKGDREGLTMTAYRKEFEEIFSELRESEDDKIMKALIEYFNEQCDMSDWNGVYGYQVVKWLEKVRRDNRFLKSIKVGDIITKSPDGILINLGQSDKALEHHDKVEPKFKVGDCITDGKEKYYITDYNIDNYQLQSIAGTVFDSSSNLVESNYHLWSIEDAKEGDILANDNVICVYKERVSEHLIKVTINYSRKEDIETHYDTIGDSDLHPATKSQRDFFISKILQSK